MKVQKLRGFLDLIADEASLHSHIRQTVKEAAQNFGCAEIILPVMESSKLFKRCLGDTSDIVTKEMFVIPSKSDKEDDMVLRPEGTAGVVRAFIENGLTKNIPAKFYYEGPNFRYERPQKGRYRQFWQSGVEFLGVDSPLADAEVIALGWQVMQKLGIDEHVQIQLNSLGDEESRNNYRSALVSYFSSHMDKLTEVSKVRLEKNPLRILDSKEEGEQEIIKNAPKMQDYYNKTSKEWFLSVQNYLNSMNVPFVINSQIVRGLDYYNHTSFEFVTEKLGSQGTVLGGGRYDGLVKMLGGADVSGVGFGAGIERIALLCEALNKHVDTKPPVVIIAIGEECELKAASITSELRYNGIYAEQLYSGNMKKKMQRANKMGAKYALILGDDEYKNNKILLKDLDETQQIELNIGDVVQHLKTL